MAQSILSPSGALKYNTDKFKLIDIKSHVHCCKPLVENLVRSQRKNQTFNLRQVRGKS